MNILLETLTWPDAFAVTMPAVAFFTFMIFLVRKI